MIAWTWTCDEDRSARDRLNRMAQDCRSLKWAWPGVAKAVALYEAKVFDTQGEMSSTGRWKDLHDLTVQARMQHAKVSNTAYHTASTEGPAGRILHWMHRLRDSVATPDGNYGVRVFTSSSFEYGTRVRYGRAHQDGAVVFGNRTLPARPFLDMQNAPLVAIGALRMLLHARWKTGGAWYDEGTGAMTRVA